MEAPVTGPVTTVLVVDDVQPATESKTAAPAAIAHAAILDLSCMLANASRNEPVQPDMKAVLMTPTPATPGTGI